MQAVLSIVQPIVDNLSKDFEKFTPVVILSQKLGVKPGHIVGASFALGLFLIITGLGSDFVTALIGFLYPAYMSFKALESPEAEDDIQWLTYWVVFVLLNFLDSVLGMVLSLIPLYHLAKLVLYVYLFYPKSKGATVIYNSFIRPLLKKYEGQIDQALDKVNNVATTVEGKLHQE